MLSFRVSPSQSKSVLLQILLLHSQPFSVFHITVTSTASVKIKNFSPFPCIVPFQRRESSPPQAQQCSSVPYRIFSCCRPLTCYTHYSLLTALNLSQHYFLPGSRIPKLLWFKRARSYILHCPFLPCNINLFSWVCTFLSTSFTDGI